MEFTPCLTVIYYNPFFGGKGCFSLKGLHPCNSFPLVAIISVLPQFCPRSQVGANDPLTSRSIDPTEINLVLNQLLQVGLLTLPELTWYSLRLYS